jgi:hypothetical protein
MIFYFRLVTTPSPSPYSASTTVKSLPSLRGPYSQFNQYDQDDSLPGFPALTTNG